MKALLPRPEERKQLSPGAQPFSALVVYENAEVRQGALHFYSRIVEECDGKVPFLCAWRSFSEVGHGSLSAEVIRTARAADMILIACAADDKLPESLTRWIDLWAGRRTIAEGALVVLIGPDCRKPEPDSVAHQYFAAIARKAGMTYFPGHFILPEEEDSFSLEGIQARAEAHTPTMEKILYPRIPGDHWGINE